MKLHRFNSTGLSRFNQFLDALADDPSITPPIELLTDSADVEPISPDIEVRQQAFANRMAAARYLHEVLLPLTRDDIQRDVGLWAWLSLLFFDQVCPADARGRRKVQARERYVPVVNDYRRSFRHLLGGIVRIYHASRDNPERALVFFCGPLNKTGHFYYQLAQRQELITNPVILGAATKLYFDGARDAPKRGAQSQEVRGSVFRFVSVLDQLDSTWDLHLMNEDQLIEMLPIEFNRFR